MAVFDQLVEKMTAVILEGFVRTGAKAEHEEAKTAVRNFLYGNMNKLVQFARDNPGKRPPIHFISDTGEVVWLSRKQDRKLRRMITNDQRRLLARD